MKKVILKSSLCLLSVLSLTACSSVWNNGDDTFVVSERHPIAVDSQVVTMTLDSDPSLNDLSNIDRARLKAFAHSFLQNGHGSLTITAPDGSQRDAGVQEKVADIRKHLHNLGVSYAQMTGATYRAPGDGSQGELVMSYTHYVATPSPCGEWSGEFSQNTKNLPYKNFGCSDQNNLAAMIADPRELIEPSTLDPRDATARVRAVEAFRAGEVTSSVTDDNIDAEVAN